MYKVVRRENIQRSGSTISLRQKGQKMSIVESNNGDILGFDLKKKQWEEAINAPSLADFWDRNFENALTAGRAFQNERGDHQ